MDNKICLLSDEINKITLALITYEEKQINDRYIEQKLTEWSNFIIEIENGYNLTIDDYTNDISLRDKIQIIIDNSHQETKDKIVQRITEWDTRFIKNTNKLNEPLIPNIKRPVQWWWYRIPINSEKMGC